MQAEYYPIVDFEATCCNKGTISSQEMEIIEIGAVTVDASTFQVIDEFQTFVRPVRHPKLTLFCTALTSIQQKDSVVRRLSKRRSPSSRPGFTATAVFSSVRGAITTESSYSKIASSTTYRTPSTHPTSTSSVSSLSARISQKNQGWPKPCN
jgi:hypothetical protein